VSLSHQRELATAVVEHEGRRAGRPASWTTLSVAGAVTAHVEALEASGYAAATVDGRRHHLGRFVSWCGWVSVESLSYVTPEALQEYRQWLFRYRKPGGAPLSLTTRCAALIAVRGLMSWAVKSRRLAVNPAAELDLPRMPRPLPRALLSRAEAELVLSEPDLRTAMGMRDRAIMEVLYSAAIRRSELVQLKVGDLDAERGVLYIREGKGRKGRVVPIGERAIHWVGRYLVEARGRLASTPAAARWGSKETLFLSRRGGRIRPNRLTERLRRYVVGAGIGKPGSCHIWRHTAATAMHDGGADIRDIQELLGHAQLSTTEIYTRVSITRLREVHARTHPAAALEKPRLAGAKRVRGRSSD
jgi:integrase/recombinase XerD